MKQKFYYQPDLATSIICWSFTGMIFLSSLLLWLEITVFQIWTALTFILFVLVSIVQILRRQVLLNEQVLLLRAVVSFNNKEIPLNELNKVKKTKYGLQLITRFRSYNILLTPKSAEELYISLNK